MRHLFVFSENFGVINLVTRLDVDLSEGTNLNTSTTYEALKIKVTYAVSNTLFY
jgi:hypothetical protein